MQEYTDILTGAPDGWIAEINTQLGGIHDLDGCNSLQTIEYL